MISPTHSQHISDRTAHNNCSECRADCERRLAIGHPFKYEHVTEYLSYVKPRIQAIRAGESSVDARIWHRQFIKALNRRISSHSVSGHRKQSDSYLDRLRAVSGSITYSFYRLYKIV